jgi:hypothetical protein
METPGRKPIGQGQGRKRLLGEVWLRTQEARFKEESTRFSHEWEAGFVSEIRGVGQGMSREECFEGHLQPARSKNFGKTTGGEKPGHGMGRQSGHKPAQFV